MIHMLFLTILAVEYAIDLAIKLHLYTLMLFAEELLWIELEVVLIVKTLVAV